MPPHCPSRLQREYRPFWSIQFRDEFARKEIRYRRGNQHATLKLWSFHFHALGESRRKSFHRPRCRGLLCRPQFRLVPPRQPLAIDHRMAMPAGSRVSGIGQIRLGGSYEDLHRPHPVRSAWFPFHARFLSHRPIFAVLPIYLNRLKWLSLPPTYY